MPWALYRHFDKTPGQRADYAASKNVGFRAIPDIARSRHKARW